MKRKLKRKLVDLTKVGLVFIGVVVVSFSPTLFFLLLRYLIKPLGFWQNFTFLGLGVWFLAFQVVGLLFLFGFILSILFNYS